MGNDFAYVGEQHYSAEDVIAYLYNLMRRFPELTAQEILMSYFTPNAKAVSNLHDKGSGPTINVVMGNSDCNPDRTTEVMSIDTEPAAKTAFYRLCLINPTRDGIHRPHHAVVVARSAMGARSIAAKNIRRFERPASYSEDSTWRDSSKVSANLLFSFTPHDTTQNAFRPRIVCASSAHNYKLSDATLTAVKKEITQEVTERLEKKYAGKAAEEKENSSLSA